MHLQWPQHVHTDELDVCRCNANDSMVDKCNSDTNHRIKSKANITILGLNYAAGRSVEYTKSKARADGAKHKVSKMTTSC